MVVIFHTRLVLADIWSTEVLEDLQSQNVADDSQ